MQQEDSTLGIVIIARNEGERLRRSLASALTAGAPLVYVDSASTDGSPEIARAAGADVVELDPSIPLSAARARNEGFRRLLELEPPIQFVQFVDGDCELHEDWLNDGVTLLLSRPDAAVACGRLHERYPEASLYNTLCDLEWDVPPGEVKACGGVFMVRAGAFRDVGGFNPAVIAGEDDELCLRLRQRGWKILRIDKDMAYHDAAIRSFRQWWQRSVRAGHCFAQGAAMHGDSLERHFLRENQSTFFWGLMIPLISIGGTVFTKGATLALLFLYGLLCLRVYRRVRLVHGWRPMHALLYACACVLGKFPQALGFLKYHKNHILKRHTPLIEYES